MVVVNAEFIPYRVHFVVQCPEQEKQMLLFCWSSCGKRAIKNQQVCGPFKRDQTKGDNVHWVADFAGAHYSIQSNASKSPIVLVDSNFTRFHRHSPGCLAAAESGRAST